MRIKSRSISIVYKCLLVALCTAGIAIQTGLFSGAFQPSMLRYFTVLSNILVALYFAADVVWLSVQKKTFAPAIKGAATMAITVTGLVAHFMLGMGFSMGGPMGISMLLLHYVVPIMSVCDWLLFDEKGKIAKTAPLQWLLFPLAYFAYILFTAPGIAADSQLVRYPYPFIDVDMLGLPKVLLTAALMCLVFVVLGYLIYALDKLAKRAAADCKKR